MNQKLKAITEFNEMRMLATLKAINKTSIERPLTDIEFKTLMKLKDKVM